MAMPLTCPRGHQWNSDEQPNPKSPSVCPICGLAPLSPIANVAPTLEYPPQPEGKGSRDSMSTVVSLSPELLDRKDRATPLLSQYIPGYEILGELGRGGMGVVYKARQSKLNRVVALKMILAGAHADPIQLDRFRAEAEAVARLHHPYIVQIYEIGEYNGCPYFSLEYVDGGTLADKLLGGPQPPRLAAHLVRLLALAMHSAHQKGIIHRDLKPGNILLAIPTEHVSGSDAFHAEMQAAVRLYGIPKITDFGLAKHLDVQSQTRTGAIIGTPSYMAPEQAEGRSHAIGPGTDVYGLGAIFYEMLTGRPPFESDSSLTTIRQLLAEDPLPPSQMRLKVPRDLETISLKCLEKDPARRYLSAEDLAQDLERFLSNRPIEARPIGWWARGIKWMRRHPTKATVSAILVLALVTLLTVGGIYHFRLQRAVEKSQQNLIRLHVAQGTSAMNDGDGFTALLWFTEALRIDRGILEHEDKHRQRIAALQQSLPTPLQLWVHEGAVNDTRISPDGKLVLTAGDEGKIHLLDSESGKETVAPLSMSGPVTIALFSPDGKRVAAASRDGTARVWDRATGKALTPPLAPGGALHGIDFSPDSRQLVTASGKTARVWDADTGKPLPGVCSHKGEVNAAVFSPDRRYLATAGDDGLVHLWDADERNPTPLVLSHGRAVLCLAFSPDGKRIASGSTDFSAQVWDIADGAPVGRRLRHHDRVTHVAFSPSGDRLLTGSEDNTAQVWRVADGEPLLGPLRHKSVVRWAAFSPDGCRVATAGDDNSARVWSANSGAPLTPPLRANGSVNHVAFSPDGRWLATASDDGTARLWNVACRHEAYVVDEAAVFRHRVDRALGVGSFDAGRMGITPSRTSPDGRLVLKINRDNIARVYNAVSGEPLSPPLPHHGEITYAAFSSDGLWIVTTSMDQTARVWDARSGAPISPPLKHASAVLYADFNVDGRRLATASDDNTASVWDIRSGEMLVPPLRHDGTVVRAVFSPDGQRVATGSLDQTARVWDADTGQILSPPMQHPWAVREVRFDSSGQHLLTTASSGATWSWELPTTNAPIEELIRLAQLLSGSRIDEHRGVMPLKMSELNELWTALRQRRNELFRETTAEHVTHWHSQTAEECVRGRQWKAALWHFNQLIEQEPENWLYRARRGRAQAELGHWKEAGDDFDEVVRRAPEEVEVWCLLALLRLRQDDLTGFRRCCSALLERQQKTKEPRIAYLSAWTCVLSADSGARGEHLVELAKQAVAQQPGDPDYLCTLGAALFRAGDWKSAEMRLNEAQAIHGLRPCVREWLWLSLVHQRTGASKEAHRWLAKANAVLGEPDASPLAWVQRVQLELLQREAEGALKAK